MKILYDFQMFTTQNVGGISRYVYELITNFDQDNSITWEIPIIYSSNIYLKTHPFFKDTLLPNPFLLSDTIDHVSKAKYIKDKILYKLINKHNQGRFLVMEYEKNKALSIEKIKEGNFDIFHPTYFDGYFMDFISNKPFVLTVHDMINQVFPEMMMYQPDKSKAMVDRADRIITVSENTKKDLINIFNVDEQKIDVVYLANSLEDKLDYVSEEFKQKIPAKYLLFVGGRLDYKNFLFFAQMFASLKRGNEDLYIVCTGSPFNASEQYLFKKLGIENYVYNTFVNDDELVYLYKNAIAFVFPSMYEGFGLPVLEAFSCGCPAVISNTSSLSEIGEDAVIYFEPKNPASMLNALESVISNPLLREEKIAKGYEQLKKYSWEKTARQTKRVYEKVLLDKRF
ncbi:MAG: glycosyltransferase family 4 protein [Mucilaginibacter sp.]|uniref:glycosyltransferase family 4 protein n=1 Tax=Mucilaginibacter sp. TaxID=1882438 RepID=UPI0034E389BA